MAEVEVKQVMLHLVLMVQIIKEVMAAVLAEEVLVIMVL
jgi:hypothetical protein